MKRSQVVNLIAGWGAPEILEDVYGAFGNRTNLKEWADQLLYVLETEVGIKPPTMPVAICYQGKEALDALTRYSNSQKWEPE